MTSSMMASMTSPRFVIVTFTIIILNGSPVSGQVQFTASPSDIQPPVTDVLEMRCSVPDGALPVTSSPPPSTSNSLTTSTTTSSDGLVGRSVMLEASKSKAEEAGNTQNGDREEGWNSKDGNRDAESTKRLDRVVGLGEAASGGDAGAVEEKMRISDKSASSAAEVRRMSSSQADPVKHVVGITISRAGKPIATVSTYNDAILEDDLDKHNGHVTGQVDIGGQGQGQELGYLNIRWSYPTDGQVGVYGCSVVGVTASGHSVILTGSLEVKTSSISLADLVMEIRDLKKSNTAQQATIGDLQSKMAAQQQTNDLHQTAIGECQSKMAVQQQNIASQQYVIGYLQSNMSTQQHDIDSQHSTTVAQQTAIGDLQSKMAATQSSLSHQQAVMQSVTNNNNNNNNNMTSLLSDLEVRLTHVETGAVRFDYPGDWDSSHTYTYSKAGYSLGGMKYKDVHIRFNTPYDRPPAVTWAVGLMAHIQDYLYYTVEVRYVTTTGCVIRAGVMGGGHSDYWFNMLIVEWTSIPR